MAYLEKHLQDKTPRIETGFIPVGEDAMGKPIKIPFILAMGSKPGKRTVLTAGIHGDELNGQKVIHEVIKQISPEELAGTLICFPVCNIPGFQSRERNFSDGIDLNHVMGTEKNKLPSHQYQKALLNEILLDADVLIDLHSERKYIESCVFAYADLNNDKVRSVIETLQLDAVINHKASLTTLRGVCTSKKITAVTIEIGGALKCEMDKVHSCTEGIINHINDTKSKIKTKICNSSTWQMIERGGYHTTNVNLLQNIEEGDIVDEVSNVFGEKLHQHKSKSKGIILGYNSFPLVEKGDKLIHIGLLEESVNEN